jgi:hypothetical protein
MNKFDKDGRLLIPITDKKKLKGKIDENVRYIIGHAYCPKGCSIIDSKNKINGYPGLRIRFKRPDAEGEFVISAIEADFDKMILSGELKEGVKDELYCPHCGTMFLKLVNCNCRPGAEMIIIGLTPETDFNDSITFCNVTGCYNGTFIKSGEVIRHIRLHGSY